MGRKLGKLEDEFQEDEILVGLRNSILEVERLLLRTIKERNILATRYSDEHEDVIKLNNYASNLIQVLQRTNIYYFNYLFELSDKNVYNAVAARFAESEKAIKQNKDQAQDMGLGWEIESYFKEKLKIARCYKNFLSQSDITVNRKTNELTEIWNMYGYSYNGDVLPECPTLPITQEEQHFYWAGGFALNIPGYEPTAPITALSEINPNDYKHYILFPPKPVIKEFIDTNNDDEFFGK